MSKKLKDFIGENRRAFDDELPSSDAWNRIEENIKNGKAGNRLQIKRLYKWSTAAAVFFIMAASTYFIIIRKNSSDKDLAKKELASVEQNAEIDGLSPEYAAKARRIVESIEARQQQLKDITTDQPKLYDQFSEDLATLDSSYRVLKNQALQTPNKEVFIKAMMQNLQLQAELLAKQLGIINEFKNNKTDKNEKDSYRSL